MAHLDAAACGLLSILRCAGNSTPPSRAHDLSPGDWNEVVQLALAHGIGPLLHRELESKGILRLLPPASVGELGANRRFTAFDNLLNYGEFRRIALALHDQGIPIIALKGLHLAKLVYGDLSVRTMSDLDVLVPLHEVPRVMHALRSLDYGTDADLAPAAGEMLDSKCNLGLFHRTLDVWLEVHWSLGEPPRQFDKVVQRMWEGAVTGELVGAPARLLAPELLLLHVCTHLAFNHKFLFSLRGLCDVAEIVRKHPNLDWQILVEHGTRGGWSRGIAATLRLAKEHLASQVPGSVIAALGGDHLDPMMLADAMQHLVTSVDVPGKLRTAPNLLAAVSSGNLLRSCRLVLSRVFVPRAELALLYGITATSPRLPFLYISRLLDLLRRYALQVWKSKSPDSTLVDAFARQKRLAQWLEGQPG